MNFNSIYFLRLLGNIEGISYLLLLGIAMPMKYFFGFPMAVKIVGMAHGVLFIAYCLLLALQMRANKWNLLFGIYLFVATLIPFGTFVTDRKLAKIQAD
jgi:integral membrane protein